MTLRAPFHLISPVALLFVFVLGAVLFMGSSSPAQPLETRLTPIVEQGNASQAFWGLHVRDAETGEVLYDMNGSRRFIPASNQKLLTTATALDALGSDYRYETGLYFDGEIEGSTLRGDLIIQGSGDPTFGTSEMRLGNPLREWARKLRALGVTRIEGRLIGDDNAFDDQLYAEGWDVDYVMTQSSRLLGVSMGGLCYNDNLARLHIRAGGAGSPPEISTSPEGVVDVHNGATTSARRSGRAIDVQRIFGTQTVRVTGSVPTNYRTTIFMPVMNPTVFTLRSFAAYLEDEGIDVSNLISFDIDDLSEEPEDYEDHPLFVHYSPPLSEILPVVNKDSFNFYADQLFRTFGWRGTADGAENRVNALLERAGADTRSLSVRDGSGLSRKNLITPQAMTQLLVYMRDHSEWETFYDSLPQGGEAETTLRYRLGNVPVRAKTGALEFARALSGYATMPDGREVAFAFFANNFDGPSYRVTQTIDRLTVALTSP